MKIGGLCFGYGGLDLAVTEVLGGELAWYSEIDPGACKIAAHRFPDVPNIGDMTTVPTEPLRVPDHLGVDHFAAFPTEFPRRIIAGWSPAGVCTACGEGRRPVTRSQRTLDGEPVDNIGGWKRGGVQQETAGLGNWRFGTDRTITGYACACLEPHIACGEAAGRDEPDTMCDDCYDEHHGLAPQTRMPPTTPAVVLGPFGGTGTTALVAKALGRHGITVDMSADYCRLAEWRCSDPGELAKAARVAKPAAQTTGQESLLDLLGGEGA